MLKTQLRTRLARWVRGGGLRPLVVVALLDIAVLDQPCEGVLMQQENLQGYVEFCCMGFLECPLL